MPTAANTQITTLTPNSNCSCTGSGDANNSTLCVFMSPPNGIQWFTQTVSNGNPKVTLHGDVGSGVVTFKKGMTIQLNSTGGNQYVVLLSGEIVDNGNQYTFTGLVIYMSTGATTSEPTVKLAAAHHG